MFSLWGWPVLCHALTYAEVQSWMGSECHGLRHSPGPSAHSSLLWSKFTMIIKQSNQKVSEMIENMNQWHILKCCNRRQVMHNCLWLNWFCVFLSPLLSAGHFMHVAVSVADVVGPLFLNWSLPALYTLMMDTSTSALPWDPGVIDITLPVNTVGDIKEDNQMSACFWCAIAYRFQ